MKSYSVTDVGQKRQVNQDYIFASEEPVEIFRIFLWLQTVWAVIRQEISRPVMQFRSCFIQFWKMKIKIPLLLSACH